MSAAEVARLRDDSPVGAWIFKANPAVWDVGSALRSGATVDQWRMAQTYRADLVAAGHPCALWVTNGDPRHEPGIWAVGEVIGEATEDVGDPDDPLWRDRAAQRQVRPYVDVRMEPRRHSLPRDLIRRDPRVSGIEVLRTPRAPNPTAATPEQWAVLSELLGDD